MTGILHDVVRFNEEKRSGIVSLFVWLFVVLLLFCCRFVVAGGRGGEVSHTWS